MLWKDDERERTSPINLRSPTSERMRALVLLLVLLVHQQVAAFTTAPPGLNRFSQAPFPSSHVRHMQSTDHVRAPSADLMAAAAPKVQRAGAVAYFLYALGFAGLLTKTLQAHPLTQAAAGVNSLLWCRAWLWTTVADYYGAALALCGVIIATEQTMAARIGWTCGCLFLGTPFCCIWVGLRLLRGGSLRLGA
jgi:hypothetical protein